MIELFRSIGRALYKPLLLILLAACCVLLWYVPKEHKTEDPIWVEVVADPKNNRCEVSLWAGGRLISSVVSGTRYDLVRKDCQIYVITH